MPIVIQPYRPEHEKAVGDFNHRLKSAGAETDLVFYERAVPPWLPPGQHPFMFNEFFLALDEGIVRGGYALKHQEFAFGKDSTHTVGYYHHPISEGIINKAYAAVGGLLLRDAMQRSPLLYCLGMGGYDRALPKMLVRLGWSHCLVPFYFRVLRPMRFLREMNTLRTTPLRRFAMDVTAYSGAGWAAAKTFDLIRSLRSRHDDSFQSEVIEDFGDWTDDVWKLSRSFYAAAGVRNSRTLRALYSSADLHVMRMRIRRHGKDIGWAVTGERRRDPKYGALRVGSILDCWASPENAQFVIRAAREALESIGLDLIVSNQSHAAWASALKKEGFFEAPSNFIFAASKKLTELLQPFQSIKSQIHFTRADGDGLPRNF